MGKGLAAWFAVWHPRYRGTLAALILVGALASCLVYLQNDLLGLLTQSLALGPSHERPGGRLGGLADFAASLGLALPLLVLALVVLVRGISAATEYWKARATGRLRTQGSNDIESQVLLHLLAKDDAFFGRHSPAETVNRLGMDLQRITQRRLSVTSVCWSVLLLAGNFAFFLSKDWRLSLVALASCVAGAVWTRYMTRHVKDLDAEYMQEDDRIKSRFEDFLRAAPEVQVGRLHEKIGRRFVELQGRRAHTFLRFIRLNALLRVGSAVAYLLAFAAMVLVVLYMRATGQVDAALALVPVVIWTLPQLFGNASELVFVNLDFELARTSVRRLLEYEAHEAEATGKWAPAVAASGRLNAPFSVRVEGATYR
jgi:ABC-type multidrug transport system fused ATPase/permease subunit